MKSQEPPESQTGPMVTVVGKTFKELVMKSDKDVFVEFYAPWYAEYSLIPPTWESVYLARDMNTFFKIKARAFNLPLLVARE